MHRKTLLRWTLLPIVFIAIALTVLALLGHDSAWAAPNQPNGVTQGSLDAVDKTGNLAGACPLKQTRVKAEVSGFISRVTVTQEFENPFSDKIEAVYRFPLPQSAAIDDFTMTIGERTIKGKMMRREEAQAAYANAKQLGQVASLLNQERPNIFTQQVANIMPGQQIHITISYVEILKYEAGFYEWSFPMVVGARYTPAGQRGPDTTDASTIEATPSDAPDIAVADMEGMRRGSDISMELSLDAGFPIDEPQSHTHEIEIERGDTKRAIVRLKNLAAIPNKDFVLKYHVNANKIEEGLLAHRDEKGGFFTLILQPPHRIAPEDVMPKELVFVLDTSGSMGGFPLTKAKETIDLALNTLNPHDTFNLITFAGETQILFGEPVLATPEHLRKARKFLASRESDGGTEMMKAIKASLEPSDSQQHIRISCFLTDGQVGNDFEIISEIQKHPNARVFAMGFGDSPNRFLLDKMAEYGRGEVDYVTETGDTSAVARRFNQRIRNPLLTDISIDWSGLPVVDTYPDRIPDLFGDNPLILTGRYRAGAKGTIRLKGKIAGEEFVRDISLELPESETQHQVLSTLWARRRIDHLMGQDMAGLQSNNMEQSLREEITGLGLSYKLMTQFTSFVAIDDGMFIEGGESRRVEVAGQSQLATPMAAYALVNMSVGATVNVSAASVSSAINARSVEDLPLQGRSFQNLIRLSPGNVVDSPALSPSLSTSTNGQRPNSTVLSVDGVTANFGIAAGGRNAGASAAGTSPALTASGGTNGIAPLDSIAELSIQTSNTPPLAGRMPGAHIDITTRAGTNEFHGSLFHFFNTHSLDAMDWFANSRRLNRPSGGLNNFGGTFGGPFRKDQVFLFASYEGLRLRQPMTGITDVPSISSRQSAPLELRSFLDAFPIQTSDERQDGFAEFASTFSNSAGHHVGTIRLDNTAHPEFAIHGRYSFADSNATERGINGSSLNNIDTLRSRAQAITGSVVHTGSPTIVVDVRANYSHMVVQGGTVLDDFGGATVPEGFLSSLNRQSAFLFDLSSRNASWGVRPRTENTQRQLNLVGSTSIISGNHSFKFGADYRRLWPIIRSHSSMDEVIFDGVDQIQVGVATRVSRFTAATPQQPAFTNFSLYGQDEWRKTSRLMLTYGLRWEINPPPNSPALAVDQVSMPSQMKLRARGTPLWPTTFGNIAPRFAFAYELSNTTNRELVLRGGAGVLFDVGHERTGDVFTDSFPFLDGTSLFNTPFPVSVSNSSGSRAVSLLAFDPNLRLPYTVRWTLSLQKSLGSSQSVSASYVNSIGRRLLNTQTLFNQNGEFPFLRLTSNSSHSNYRALQIQFDRHVSDDLSTSLNYTWSNSTDNVILDSARQVFMRSEDPELDYGSSDFDVRHALSGFVSYGLPAPFKRGTANAMTRNWFIESLFNARSARPLNIVYQFPTSFGFASLRPDLLESVPLYLTDSTAAGSRRINPAALIVPDTLRQGNLGRNAVRGFPFYQVDLALRRRFAFNERVSLQVQADAFNLFNHPNFADPLAKDLSVANRTEVGGLRPNLTFGRSASLRGRSLLADSTGSFSSLYTGGGPRAFRFSVKLMF